jgi:hypothetical protein
MWGPWQAKAERDEKRREIAGRKRRATNRSNTTDAAPRRADGKRIARRDVPRRGIMRGY